MSKRTWDTFMQLYQDTVHDDYQVNPDKLEKANTDLSQRRMDKRSIHWYPIYSDKPNSYQADLMFEPYVNSKGEKILQAILCLININTKYAFASAVDYTKNVKGMDERDWASKSTRILLNNKDSGLVLRALKRILDSMKGEADALNEFKEMKGSAHFQVDHLYVDEGSEFKGEFKQYCENNNIQLHVFSPQTGSKRRLAIVERFNRTLRRLLEKQLHMLGKKPIKDLLPDALDLYNRYLNHRGIEAFLRREKQTTRLRYFPAMMMVPGVEQEYIQHMRERTRQTDAFYNQKLLLLKPGAQVRYFKRSEDSFGKSRGSTLSKPTTIVGKHVYGSGQQQGVSFSVEDGRQRYLPYELEVVNPPSKNKISRTQEKKQVLI